MIKVNSIKHYKTITYCIQYLSCWWSSVKKAPTRVHLFILILCAPFREQIINPYKYQDKMSSLLFWEEESSG